MSKNNYYYTDARIAVRNAMGNLGYGENIYQTMEPDLIRWATEAQDLIIRNSSSMPMIVEDVLIYNNQIANRPDFQVLENISIHGWTVPYDQSSKSTPLVSVGSPIWGCQNGWGGESLLGKLHFRINQYFITFSPNIEDGTPATIQYLCKPTSDDGYPMIIDRCARAIGYYIGSMLCERMSDPRADSQQKRWLAACVQARAEINEMTEEQKMAVGQAYIGLGGGRRRRRWQWY